MALAVHIAGQDTCPICLNCFVGSPDENKVALALLEACCHLFCLTCITRWQKEFIMQRDTNATSSENVAMYLEAVDLNDGLQPSRELVG